MFCRLCYKFPFKNDLFHSYSSLHPCIWSVLQFISSINHKNISFPILDNKPTNCILFYIPINFIIPMLMRYAIAVDSLTIHRIFVLMRMCCACAITIIQLTKFHNWNVRNGTFFACCNNNSIANWLIPKPKDKR